ncbi:MAG: hypothetical protein ACUVUE_04730 [Candidatus Bathycorpusculaceae bacterium]
MKQELRIEILRNVAFSRCPFVSPFKGFDESWAVKRIFGADAREVLERLEVEFTNAVRYMEVDNLEGRLLVNPMYLSNGDFVDIYLDVIHELVHVKQFHKGETSNKKLSYIERPLEIEAYQVAVNEAKTLGLHQDRIIDYLDSDLINNEELKKLAEALEIRCERS